MKRLFFTCFVSCFSLTPFCQSYQPSQANLEQRQQFRDMKFGMFIHWGAFSVPGSGEWVMNERRIPVTSYHRLINFFNPIHYDPKKWVESAKNAGMKYITFITRHHDGFSNWDTKQSDWKITNTPYEKDAFRMLADECHHQGIRLFVYYSLLDWSRDDYPYETGRTGKYSGRKNKSNYESYLRFMKAQLTELLTNYGEIAGVWFDGHWDQTAPEGATDRSSKLNWHYDEIYSLIHRLQPQCLIGNNHHLTPFPGEDFQMFERDLPGENKSGLSFQEASQQLPLETCETMNDSWGFNLADKNYKSVKQLVQYLVNAAGRDANFLLNIGPMPDGNVQPEFIDTLASIGNWLKNYGESVYGTRGNIIPPQEWGVITEKNKNYYAHILKQPKQSFIFLPGITKKITGCSSIDNNSPVKFRQEPEGVFIDITGLVLQDIDTILRLNIN
ncbi:MAG: alpha-L-fucosidase [Chitinophagaceae bacterium]|nr:alpha-L-fucosidase [Chitinophagaceae bacterium]